MLMLIVLLFIVAHMCLMWCWYRVSHNPSVVDVGWAIGLTLCGLIYLSQQPLSYRLVLFGVALMLWGGRLGGYLWWTRIRRHEVDKRYTALSNSWKINKPLGFFVNFQLQGVFMFMVSCSWYFIATAPLKSMTYWDGLGLILFVFALILETRADMQLQEFKKNHPGDVCNQKLWSMIRHPNYFFEWLIWCSYSLWGLSSPYGLLSLLSPAALYVIMNFMTIPITERESIKSRGERYLAYQKNTPAFFPRFRMHQKA